MCFPIFCSFSLLSVFLASIASRFLVTFLMKKYFSEPSRRVPFGPLFLLVLLRVCAFFLGVSPTTFGELQTCTCQGPGASNTTKIQREDPQEREERKKIVGGRWKKNATFWAHTPFGAPPSTLRVAVGVREGGDFGLNRTNLHDFFFFLPKSNKGPMGLSRIGHS